MSNNLKRTWYAQNQYTTVSGQFTFTTYVLFGYAIVPHKVVDRGWITFLLGYSNFLVKLKEIAYFV